MKLLITPQVAGDGKKLLGSQLEGVSEDSLSAALRGHSICGYAMPAGHFPRRLGHFNCSSMDGHWWATHADSASQGDRASDFKAEVLAALAA